MGEHKVEIYCEGYEVATWRGAARDDGDAVDRALSTHFAKVGQVIRTVEQREATFDVKVTSDDGVVMLGTVDVGWSMRLRQVVATGAPVTEVG